MNDVIIGIDDIATQQMLYDLEHRGKIEVALGEESYAIVYRINDVLLLFEIPSYGGYERYRGSYHISDAYDLVMDVNGWT
jgi:hypothetical protein